MTQASKCHQQPSKSNAHPAHVSFTAFYAFLRHFDGFFTAFWGGCGGRNNSADVCVNSSASPIPPEMNGFSGEYMAHRSFCRSHAFGSQLAEIRGHKCPHQTQQLLKQSNNPKPYNQKWRMRTACRRPNRTQKTQM